MRKIAIIGVLVLAACGTTQQARDALGRRYVGQSLDAFVQANGAPFVKQELNSGELRYYWRSGVRLNDMPATSKYEGNVLTTYSTSELSKFCELRIVTDPDGTVKSIVPIRDTLGNKTGSRCAEIFADFAKL